MQSTKNASDVRNTDPMLCKLRTSSSTTAKGNLSAFLNSVEWRYKKNTLDAVQELHDQGFTVLAIEQVEGSTLLDKLELDADKKYAIVMGNEVKGVQQEVVNACDGCVEIPQYGTKHSLNVSVTTGIILWEFANKLMKFR